MSPLPSNARKRSQLETRRRILESAARVFYQNSKKEARVADIAAGAQIAVGTFYLHFKDKNSVLKTLMRAALSNLKEEIASNQTNHDSTVANKMAALASFVEKNPELAALLFDGSNLSTIPGQEALDFLIASQKKSLLEGVADGVYRGDLSMNVSARAMVGSLVFVLGWWAKNIESATNSEIVTALTTIRLEGLGTR